MSRSALMVLVTVILMRAAHADQILTQETILFSGTESQTISLGDPGAGIVNVTLTDLAWPTKAASLSFSMTTDSSVLQPLTSSPDTFSVTGATALYAHIAGVAQGLGIPGLPNFGLFSLQINFTPAAAVPLPGSLWLLISALSGLLGLHLLRGSAGRPMPQLPAPMS